MRISLFIFLVAMAACAGEPKAPEAPKAAVPETEKTTTPDTIDYDSTEWTELIRLDSTLILDIRYATTNNFTGEQIYDCGRCFLRKKAAEKLLAVQRELRQKGLGLKLFDCYRPRPYQWKLWEKVPNPAYVADPRKGSMHNRGAAVDLTIVDSLGRELPMGTGYDFFGPEAHHSYTALPDSILANRRLLLQTMERHGFEHIRTEWWHYSLRNDRSPMDDWVWGCKTL